MPSTGGLLGADGFPACSYAAGMDVQETTIRQLLEGSKQYVVPLYQRPYGWGARQRTRLWQDVLRLAALRRTNPAATHFMGSLVLASGRVGPTGVEFFVVDGQQRLTTLSILLCAIRDHLGTHRADDPMLAASLHDQYIADRYKSGDARLKLLPTRADRETFRSVVDDGLGASSDATAPSEVTATYRDFRSALDDLGNGVDHQCVEHLRDAVLGGLAFVSITAKGDDDVYRIFESINTTGLQLTQADLVRNHLFMRLGSRGETVYTSWWLPMQERLSAEDLELLFWLDAVADSPSLKQSEIHAAVQSRLAERSDADVVDEVVRLARLSELLAVIRQPSQEPDAAVRLRLEHLAEWASTTTVPITLRLLARRASGRSTSHEVAGALAAIESFLVRRSITGRGGEGVNRTLLQACGELRDDAATSDDRAVLDYLSAGRKHFADDAAVTDAVLNAPYYLRGRRPHQKLILAWIEDALRPKEPIDLSATTIEHVLPQRLTPTWRRVLDADAEPGETVEALHDDLVHTLGNLTLTGYNAELGNRPFEEKRVELQASGLQLNHRIAAERTWGRQQIRARGAWLAERICALWLPPDPEQPARVGAVRWDVVHRAVAAVPAGSWTSYGDLAALVGTHPMPIGQHLATTPMPNAHRVLHAQGSISPASRWSTADGRDVRTVLVEEGIVFGTVSGRASQSQRLDAAALSRRLAVPAPTPSQACRERAEPPVRPPPRRPDQPQYLADCPPSIGTTAALT
jgi:alkylated DNA nucleotide flippase Atl1